MNEMNLILYFNIRKYFSMNIATCVHKVQSLETLKSDIAFSLRSSKY